MPQSGGAYPLGCHRQCKLFLCLFKHNLIFITYQNLNWLFSWFGELPKLQSVYISFTIKDASLNGFNQRQLEEALTFPIKKISIIRRFLETHPSIAKLSIVNWPGLTKADLLKRISGVVAARKIKLLFKEY